jgi:VWFA-related protein
MNIARLRFPILAIAALCHAFAQGPPPGGQPNLTIRSTTTLVQVNVVARDAQGRPVEDLVKADFEILDNGKPQSIAVFTSEKLAQGEAAPAPAPAGTFTNQLPQRPSSHGGYSVILLDYLNSGFRSAARGRMSAIEVVNRLGPGQAVALYTLDRLGLHVESEIGSDRSKVLQKLAGVTGVPAVYYQRSLDGQSDAMDSYGAGGSSTLDQEEVAALTNLRIIDTLNSFQAIAGHLAGLPGRKGLIWISSAFPMHIDLRGVGLQLFPDAFGGKQTYSTEFARAMRALNNADVALYPVDARGLSLVSPVDSAADFTWPAMDFFAGRTGGVAFYGRGDLDVGIRAAVEDIQVSYTLGFYTSKESERGGFHKLSVRSTRPGVTLRYKEGYYSDAAGGPKAEERRVAAERALTGIMDATSIPIEVSATRARNTLKLLIALRPATLALEKKGDRWRGAIEFAMRFAKENGAQSGAGTLRKVEFNLTQTRYDAAQRDGLVFSRTIEIPRDAKSLRVLVRDNASSEIGTLTIPLEKIAGD